MNRSFLPSAYNAAAKEARTLIAPAGPRQCQRQAARGRGQPGAAQQKVAEAQANADPSARYGRLLDHYRAVRWRCHAGGTPMWGHWFRAGTVQAGTAGNSNSMPLVSFAELKRLRLEFPVPEPDVPVRPCWRFGERHDHGA